MEQITSYNIYIDIVQWPHWWHRQIQRFLLDPFPLRPAGSRPGHAFEFRHSSWFRRFRWREGFKKQQLSLVSLHLLNDTSWAGDLESGWHGLPEVPRSG